MKKFTEQIVDTLKEGVEIHGTAYKLAKASGVQLPTLGRWLEGTPPRLSAVEPVLDHLQAQIVLPGQSVRDFKRLLQIQASDVSAWKQEKEAGHPVPESVLAYLLARKHLNSDICFSVDLLALLGVEAQSALLYIYPDTDGTMFPTLRGGDQLLVDTRRKEVEDTQLYLIEDNGFKVRRLVSNFGSVIMSADSPTYSDLSLQKSENGQYPIVGQVVWVGKSLV